MRVSIRFAVMSTVICACQMAWGQVPVEFPMEGTIVEGAITQGTVMSQYPTEGVIEGAIYDGGIVNEGGIINDGGVVNEGVVYAGDQYPTTSSVGQVSYAQAVPSQTSNSAVSDILSVVNQKRRRSGLSTLSMDPNLTQIAQNKSNIRANRRITGHDGSYKGNARVEGVGYAYGGNLTNRFNTCYLYSNGYSYAGAAISYDNRGQAYYTLLLR